MATKFNAEIGEIYEVLEPNNCPNASGSGTTHIKVTGLRDSGDINSYDCFREPECIKKVNSCTCHTISSGSVRLYKNNKSIMSNLKEIVSNLFTTEPQKSRQIAGITDKEGQLTSDGKEVFLNYLLSKDDGAFDKTIVKPVVEEIEKSKK